MRKINTTGFSDSASASLYMNYEQAGMSTVPYSRY